MSKTQSRKKTSVRSKLVGQIVFRLRRYNTEGLAGDEHQAKSLWDHWKLEIQEDRSYIHSLLENEIWNIASMLVDDLSSPQRIRLSDETKSEIWYDDADEILDDSSIIQSIMKSVNALAANEPHRAAIQACLNRSACYSMIEDRCD